MVSERSLSGDVLPDSLTSFTTNLSKFLRVCFFRIPWRRTQRDGYKTGREDIVDPFTHRVVDEVHGVADVVEHASVGHDQVAMFESLPDAGREEGQRSFKTGQQSQQLWDLLGTVGGAGRVQVGGLTLCICCIW